MRERINRLAKGIIDMETPALTIWPERMEEEIPADEVTRKDFFVTSGNGLHIKGLVYSSNLRVRALTGSFGGFRNRITYEIDGNKLEYGDQIEGSFYLVTNGGEKEIPYSFRVQNSASGKTLDRLKRSVILAIWPEKILTWPCGFLNIGILQGFHLCRICIYGQCMTV